MKHFGRTGLEDTGHSILSPTDLRALFCVTPDANMKICLRARDPLGEKKEIGYGDQAAGRLQGINSQAGE